MKGIELAAFFVIAVTTASCQASAKYDGYQVWRVTPSNDDQRHWLRKLEVNGGYEVDFWTSVSKVPGASAAIMVAPRFQAALGEFMSRMGMSYEVTISDVSTLITSQNAAIKARRETAVAPNSLADFDYNVYHPYDEIDQWVADMVAENSDIVSPFTLGRSYKGHEINGFRIRGTGSQSAYPTAVWFEGGIHAREWISPATVMGVTQKLIDDYRSGETLATQMLDNLDWYIVPSINPDGYKYTWSDDRVWRKTRSPNQGSSCMGTDGNRNWPYGWGGEGTSPWACSDIYHGTAPNSEPEVAAVVRFVRERKAEGQDFIVFIDWHSASQFIIAPWLYRTTDIRSDDYDDHMACAQAMSDAIFNTHGAVYTYGAGAEIIYTAAGCASDFGYGDYEPLGEDTDGGLGAKYSFTVELRDTGEYGHLLPEDQIQPTYEENYNGVRAMGDHVLRELGYIQ